MSPRRPIRDRTLTPQRARRGRSGGSSTGEPRLLVTAAPPGEFRSGVATTGASVRLVSATGQNLFTAGVPVTIALALGGLASLVSTPTTAITNTSGVATFSALTLTGPAGTYALEFSAPGYLGVTSSGHSLVAGPAVAIESGADVPSGRIGAETTVLVRLRDAQGNELQVAGTSSVTVQVAGANPVPQVTVGFVAGIGYRYRYTPSTAGTDTLTIRYGGTQIEGSPYTSVVSGATGGFHAGSLRVGINNNYGDLLGTGPRVTGGTWDTREPIFRVSQGPLNPTELEAAIDYADEHDILILCSMPGSGNSVSDISGDCKRWNQTKFETGVQDFVGRPKITNALARRRVLWYMFDEPWHSHWCGTQTPLVMRNAHRYVKAIWPNSIVVSRFEPQYMRGGWGGSGPLPVNYFDKLDYSWATFRGNRDPSKGETPREYFQRAKGIVNAAGYGVIYSHNWINLGDQYCWDANNTGSSSGRIFGDNASTSLRGTFLACSATSSNTFWLEDPARIVAVAQAAAEDPDAPCCMCYQHPGSSGASVSPIFQTLMKRADLMQAWIDALRIGEARPEFSGWRDPK